MSDTINDDIGIPMKGHALYLRLFQMMFEMILELIDSMV